MADTKSNAIASATDKHKRHSNDRKEETTNFPVQTAGAYDRKKRQLDPE